MDRRKALKNLGLISGGLLVLPSCDFSKENVSRVMNNLEVTESQESLLKNLVEAYIPETDIPGGIGLKLDEFVWVMVDDCLPKDQQDSFLRGLSSFESLFMKINGNSFSESTAEQKSQALSEIASGEANDPERKDVLAFVEISKSFAVLGFMRSEYLMSEVMPYTLVPGKYPACRTLDPNEKVNIYA